MQRYDLPRVAVISLAKRVEEVFVPGRPDPILLPDHSPGLQLLQRLRDEAHRFAITFHRQRRDATARESMFDQLEGVGPVRRRALLQHFGSAERRAGRDAPRSSRAFPACRRRRRGRSTRSCTAPAAPEARPHRVRGRRRRRASRLRGLRPDRRAHRAVGRFGELIAAASVLGIAHPPGYPLYSCSAISRHRFRADRRRCE